MAGLLAYGNAAKLYCLDRIDELAGSRTALAIVDLGCGASTNFLELLRRRPHVRYVGVEPDAGACAAARAALAGLDAEVVQAPAYDVRVGAADVVASFSVLEHVYRRRSYLRCVAAHLAEGGVAFVNYDAGHFVAPSWRDRAKTPLGRLAARAGAERWYQSFVREREFRGLAEEAGLRIVEAKSFNLGGLKEAYRAVPAARRDDYMRRWLELELSLGELGIEYDDSLAHVFRTRNVVLARAG